MDEMALVPVNGEVITQRKRTNLARISNAARPIARQDALRQYHKTLATNTINRHKVDLAVFSEFLRAAGEDVDVDALMLDLSTWEGVNEGLLEAFKEWMLQQGHSIGSVNLRLSTVKRYCTVAAKAGFVDPSDLGLINKVYGYRGREGRNVDAKRVTTRVGNKKVTPTTITAKQVEQLLGQEDSRDALLMYLFLRLGFRVGEVAGLEVSNVDLRTGHIKVYRQKTDLEQNHSLQWGGIELFRRYLDEYNPQGKVFHGELKTYDDGREPSTDYTIRAIQKRVQKIGEAIGVEHLSPHDLRHDFATRMARQKTHIKVMQDAGGWKSPYMALRYVESNAIANEGVVQ